MSRTQKHPPKPDHFTRRHTVAAQQARARRDVATLRRLRVDVYLPDWLWDDFLRKAGEEKPNPVKP